MQCLKQTLLRLVPPAKPVTNAKSHTAVTVVELEHITTADAAVKSAPAHELPTQGSTQGDYS